MFNHVTFLGTFVNALIKKKCSNMPSLLPLTNGELHSDTKGFLFRNRLQEIRNGIAALLRNRECCNLFSLCCTHLTLHTSPHSYHARIKPAQAKRITLTCPSI